MDNLKHTRVTIFRVKKIRVTAIQFNPEHMPRDMQPYVPIIRSNCQKCGRDCNTHGIMGKDIYCPGDYIVSFGVTKFPMDEHTFRRIFEEDET